MRKRNQFIRKLGGVIVGGQLEQLADNGRSVEYILKDAYANTNQEGIGNIGALIYH